MTKQESIRIVNKYSGTTSLNISNTHFSKINKSKEVWWFNIPPNKFNSDLHLILKKNKTGFLWIRIKSHTFNKPERIFKLRPDTNKIDLEISSKQNNSYMRDIKSGGTNYNFSPHIEHDFDCTT